MHQLFHPLLALLLILVGINASAAEPAVAELAAYDRIIPELMRKWEIPGGAVAVAKNGRLVLARGYGLADVEKNRPVRPDALMRIASVSKPITAAAILVLVEQDRLDLDARVVDLLGPIKPMHGRAIDPGFRKITVRQLLHHTAGFDRGKSFDPMLSPRPITDALGPMADGPAIVRFMLDRPLDFKPGSRYAYSNFGYCLLGRVIEQITGSSYEEAVGQLVLKPSGITRMRLGHTRLKDRAKGEARYYPPPVESILPEDKGPVDSPYGRFYLEPMDSHGGWIASAVDLVRFATWLDGSRKPGLLEKETRRLIESRPGAPVSVDTPTYYGLGWMVRPKEQGANWWHAGSLPGTNALLVRTHHGMVWAAVFNSRPKGDGFLGELDRALWQAAGEVEAWPPHDRFERFE